MIFLNTHLIHNGTHPLTPRGAKLKNYSDKSFIDDDVNRAWHFVNGVSLEISV